jgi:two-component system, chemotaxis family, chemotaxis protein CheY
MAKIMIVDDSQLSRRILRGLLEPHGHEVVEEADGMAALERYFLEKPSCVFLDMTMKGMHGLDVLSKLRAMDPNAKVIIGTADIQSSTREMTAAQGACAFIEKPFTAEKVAQALESIRSVS